MQIPMRPLPEPRSVTITSPSAGAAQERAAAQNAGTNPAAPPVAPGLREFIARQQRNAMMANNQWKPEVNEQADSAWNKLSDKQRENATLLPSHTYTMTPFESDRVRTQVMSADEQKQRTGGRQMSSEPLVGTNYIDPLERIHDPVYASPMSRKEYDKLSVAEKAAIDFNGAFLDARTRDFENQEKYEKTVTEEQRKKYDDDVTQMFGGMGGSELYAPNTVSLLKSLDFQAVGHDLDEYLSLERLISADEMKGFDFDPDKLPKEYTGVPITEDASPDRGVYEAIRSDENLAALDARLPELYAEKVDQVLKDGYLRMSTTARSLESARSALTLGYGGVGFNETPKTGFPAIPTPGSPEATMDFGSLSDDQKLGMLYRGAYEYAINKENKDTGQLWQWIDEILDEEEQPALWDYVRTRLSQDAQWGVPDMVAENFPDRRTPAEAEAFLGMEG